jgi:hypothetical protein
MEDLDKARAQAEARESAARRSSADRARFWAGLNRYLAAEAAHAHDTAEREREREEPPPAEAMSRSARRES